MLTDDDFRRRVHNDARLHAIVTMLEIQLSDCHVNYADIARCAVLACQRHAERNCVPVMIQILETP